MQMHIKNAKSYLLNSNVYRKRKNNYEVIGIGGFQPCTPEDYNNKYINFRGPPLKQSN